MERAFRERQSLETGAVEFVVTDYLSGLKPSYHGTLFGPVDHLAYLFGDERGVIGGEERPDRPCATLNTAAASYLHDGSFVFCSVGAPTTMRVWRPRSFGLAASMSVDEPAAMLEQLTAAHTDATYTERKENGLLVVSRREGVNVATWWLDPNRDFAPLRVRFDSEGSFHMEGRFQLAQYDGVWFPREMEFYRAGAAGESGPAMLVTVLSAEFNRSGAPRTFRPADAGLEPGMIAEPPPGGRGDSDLMQIWDGERAVPLPDFNSRLAAGEIKRGARNRAALDAGKAAAARLAREVPQGQLVDEHADAMLSARLSRWERYTADFIRQYKLDEDQSQKAWQVLRDCEDRARQLVASARDRVDAIENELGAAPRADDGPRRSELRQRLRALLEPVEDVFQGSLKPRLDRIPTDKQRAVTVTATEVTAAQARLGFLHGTLRQPVPEKTGQR